MLIPIAASLALGLAGCGGSGGDGRGPIGGGPPDPGVPRGGMTLAITAVDAFDQPVPNAEIRFLRSSGNGYLDVATRTDANGRAEIVGSFEDVYAALLRVPDAEGISYEPNRPSDKRIEFDVTLHPDAALAAGVSNLSVTSVTADGRQLDFSARLYVVERNAGEILESWNLGDVFVLPCSPDSRNDEENFEADCVEGSSGSDAAYEGATRASDWVAPATRSDPLAIALLVDQGASVTRADPEDRRLLAARYLQTRLGATDQAAVAAFAMDDAGTGDVALIPDQPVTLFPITPSGFTAEGRDYFPAIDSFASLEGGASPLYAAAREMIDFAAVRAPAGSRPAVVIQASDIGDCATTAECRAAQDALRTLSDSANMPFVVVGLPDAAHGNSRRKFGALAQSALGTVVWANDAKQIPTVFGRIPEILSGRHAAIDVRIRLKSPVADAFAAGRTVFGVLHVVVCPWDCTESAEVPFTLHIP